MLVFGHDGLPVIAFPTSQQRYYELKDSKLIESAAKFIESGKIKIYCPDSVDSDSWYNYSIQPADRVRTHIGYENLIINDVIEFAKHETEMKRVVLAGCSFGAFHAANISFKYPDRVSGLICMGGSFDVKQFIYGYYDDNCYFNSPLDYLPNLTDHWYLDNINKIKIILGTGDWDMCLDENLRLSKILTDKGINHKLDVRYGAGHDWPWWRQMFPEYLTEIVD